jgi:hypothetical protein
VADTKISALTAASAAAGANELPINEAGTSKKLTVTQIQTFIGAQTVVNGGLETVNAVGNSSTSQTIGLTTGNIQTYTVNGNCTFTMPSGLTSGKGIAFTVILTDSGGPRNITFTGVKWDGGYNPTAMSAASAVDIYTFLTIDGGTTWYGFTGGTGMAV